VVTREPHGLRPRREAWIGTREIADKIGMSRFTVMKMVSRLEGHGHLEVDPGKGRGHSNHYRLVRKGAPANLLDGEKVSPRT
jgi:biotin operon repressor